MVQVCESLCERYFGSGLELSSHDNYHVVWAADVADTSSTPGGDGESVEDVATRLKKLMKVRDMGVGGGGGVIASNKGKE